MSEIDLIQKEEDLVYFGERIEPFFASNLIISGMLNPVALKQLFNWDTAVRWFQYNYQFWELKDDLIQAESELSQNLKTRGIGYVDGLIRLCMEYGQDFLEGARGIGATAVQLSANDKLASALESFFQLGSRYTTFYCLALFERPVMQIAQELVNRNAHTDAGKAELFDLVTTSSKETVVEREQEDFLKIAVSASERREQAAEHAKKYGWLALRFYLGTPWSADDVLKRLEHIDHVSAKTELEKRLTSRKKREERIQLAVTQLSPEDKIIVEQIRGIVFLRNQRADFYNEASYAIRPLLEKISVALDVPYADLMNLCASEIVDSLKGLFDHTSHIERRKRSAIILHTMPHPIVLEDEDAQAYVHKRPFLRLEAQHTDKIVGTSAYKGKVTGVAKIVHLVSELDKVNKGDILVTAMTIPNFTPAMERAAAFVTDEGGVTCHAAITAREMHKPCITGTKIATKVLKDGDMVEVDAEKGIVKKLSG